MASNKIYNDQEIKDLALKLETAGAPISEIEEFVSSAKSEQSAAPSFMRTETGPVFGKPGVLGKEIKEYGKGIVTLPTTAARAIVGRAVEALPSIERGEFFPTASSLAGAAKDVTGEIATSVIGNIPVVKDILNLPPVQAVLSIPGAVAEQVAKSDIYKGLSPEARGLVDFAGNIIGTGLNILGTKAGIESLRPTNILRTGERISSAIDTGLKPVAETISKAKSLIPKVPEKAIYSYYEEAIKPSVVGKVTSEQTKIYRNRVESGINSIVENKSKLNFVDESGAVEAGRVPQSVQEFSDAIGQTRKEIFKQYNEKAKEAGQSGALIDLSEVGSKLDSVISNKALQISHPEAINYAENLKSRLSRAGSVDTEIAEQIIQNYNNSLKSFYKNPTYETASKVAIDAGIAGDLRKFLDEKISQLTGPGYQQLKNKYGALKTIEQEVAKKANMEARRNLKGLIDYTDIFSTGDMVGGILTLNPTLFVKGVVERGVKKYIKNINSPDATIKKMFNEAEKRYSSSGQTQSNILITNQAIPTATGANNKVNINTNIPEQQDMSRGGFINLNARIGGNIKIPVEDQATMSDFTDYIRKEYKPGKAEALKLELDASRIWEKYMPDKTIPKTLVGIAHEFGRKLEQLGFKKTLPKSKK